MHKTLPPFLSHRPRLTLWIAVLLILAIGYADYATGYGLRLSVFYLVPIALATWVGGLGLGLTASFAASLFWLVSFESANFYKNQALFFWEAGVLLAGFVADAWLVSRLRDSVNRADARFTTVVEEMPAAVCMTNDQGEILYANPELRRLAAQRALSPTQWLSRLVGVPASGVQGNPASFQLHTVQDPVSHRWYLKHSGTVPWSSNSLAQLVVLTDITEKQQSDALLARNRDIMHQFARLTTLSEVASTLAHEINQPLMSIATYTDASMRMIDRDRGSSSELYKAMERSHHQAVKASAIVQRLNDFVRNRQPTGEHGELQTVIRDVLTLCEPEIRRKGIHIAQSLPDQMIRIQMDRILLTQVIHNILKNAIEATDDQVPGTQSIVIGGEVSEPDIFRLRVRDVGCGVTEDILEQIFEPFYSTKETGLGLGLAISRSIIDSHGGRLSAALNPGGGLTLQLDLPLFPL